MCRWTVMRYSNFLKTQPVKSRKKQRHAVCSAYFCDFIILQHLQQTHVCFQFFSILEKTWKDLFCNTPILCKFGFPFVLIAIKLGLQSKGIKILHV